MKSARQPAPKRSLAAEVAQVIASLERLGNRRVRDQMGPRFGIHVQGAFGVPMARIQTLAKRLGADHALAEALWRSGCYEARLLAAFVAEPARVTSAQMDRWCRGFDNWGVCDTVCFKLWDRTPHAFAKVEQWADSPGEFQKRAAFALLACLALHDKEAADDAFATGLGLIERAASDERNFVKKAVNWALRAIGERSVGLHAAAIVVAERLAGSDGAAARWVGKGALRELGKPAVARRLLRRRGH